MDAELKSTIMTIGLGVIGLLLTYSFFASVNSLRRTFAATQWPKTRGRVNCSRIEVDDSGDGVSYIPHVEYTYSVDRKIYESKSAYLGSLWQTRSHARYLTNKFKKNEAVVVSYNPKNPSDSTLITGLSRLNVNAVGVILFCGLTGFYFTAAFIHGIRLSF